MSDDLRGPDDLDDSDDLHDLVGAYALGALIDADAERFEDHLQTCATCQDELFRMSGVVDGLASLPAPGQPVSDGARPEGENVVELTRKRLPWWAAAAAASAIVVGVWMSGVFDSNRVEAIATASDAEVVTLEGEAGMVDVVLSDGEQGIALHGADFDELADPELYVLWVFRHDGDGPEFVGNITDFDDVEKAWDIVVDNVDALAISVEQAPSPETPSERVIFVGQRDR